MVINFYPDIIGYIGMIFVIISFLFKNIKWLRILNIIGGSLSMVYGFATQTYPTAILNLSLVVINSIMLIELIYKQHKEKL